MDVRDAPKYRVGDRIVSAGGVEGVVERVANEPHYEITYDTRITRFAVPESSIAGLAAPRADAGEGE